MKVDPPPNFELENARKTETLPQVMKEPLGKLLFRTYLRDTNALEHLLFIDSVDEYENNPDEHYRKRFQFNSLCFMDCLNSLDWMDWIGLNGCSIGIFHH